MDFQMNIKNTVVLLLPLISTNLYAASSPYSLNMNAGILYDDNVARASLSQDIVSDTILNLGITADYRFHKQEHDLIILSVIADTFQYQDFDKLSNIVLSGKAEYQIQPDHGFTAPWYFASFEYSLINYQSSLRDSDGFTIELGLGKRLTDRITLRSGYVYENFTADANEFDINNNRIYLSFDYKATANNIVYLTLGYTDGDFASSTSDNTTASSKTSPSTNNKSTSTQALQSHHLPSEVPGGTLRPDDAFSNGFVYQLDTDAMTLQLGDNFALSSHQSIDASIFYYTADSYGDADYDGIIAQLSYLHQF